MPSCCVPVSARRWTSCVVLVNAPLRGSPVRRWQPGVENSWLEELPIITSMPSGRLGVFALERSLQCTGAYYPNRRCGAAVVGHENDIVGGEVRVMWLYY